MSKGIHRNSRGSLAKEVEFLCGYKSEIRHSIDEEGIALVFWYFIQYPCNGWVEFDLRCLADIPISSLFGLNESLSNTEEIISEYTFADFKKIIERK